ncbi:MAG TPA: class I SAM-dependent methyltransferase [Candidatus Dojkabacteria bacterium]|nr:class I SAM-dependent methyltransferase [Candidatus Dojkabacteria bacterium]
MVNTDFDSTEYRQYIWDKEYSTRKGLPSTNTTHPSTSLRMFLEKYKDINKDYALDVGCGAGRNSFYLIDNGFKHVVGIDLSQVAIDLANKESEEKGYHNKIAFKQGDIANELKNVPDNSFDLIIDMMSLHAMTKWSRESVIKEVQRTLKPNGYLLIFTITAASPAAIDLMKKYPGPEENSYRYEIAKDTITEKAFTQEELEKAFDKLKLISWENVTSETKAFDNVYSRVYSNVLFKKV